MTETGASTRSARFRHLRVLLMLAAGASLSWFVCHLPGEERGELSVPGTLALELGAGDRLTFTADSDVLFDDWGDGALPRGCELSLLLAQGEHAARASC